jgi:hypothetical protein
MSGSHKLDNGIGGAFDRAGWPKALTHVGQAGAELRASGRVTKEMKNFGCDTVRREIVLDQFGHHAPLSN